MHHPNDISKVPLLNINIYWTCYKRKRTNPTNQNKMHKSKQCLRVVNFYHLWQTSRRRAAKKSSVSKTLLLGRFEICKPLDSGTFAKVYPARNVKTHESVAIKFTKRKCSRFILWWNMLVGVSYSIRYLKGRLRKKYTPTEIFKKSECRAVCLQNLWATCFLIIWKRGIA